MLSCTSYLPQRRVLCGIFYYDILHESVLYKKRSKEMEKENGKQDEKLCCKEQGVYSSWVYCDGGSISKLNVLALCVWLVSVLTNKANSGR